MAGGSSRGEIKMSKSTDIETELENMLIGKLSGVEMSEFRSLLEKYYLSAFDDGQACERGETTNEVD
jgi:hypothetical protein